MGFRALLLLIVVLMVSALVLSAQDQVRQNFSWTFKGENDPILQVKNRSEETITLELRIVINGESFRYPDDLEVAAGESRLLSVREMLEHLSSRYNELRNVSSGTLQTEFLGDNQQLQITLVNLNPKTATATGKSRDDRSPVIRSLEPPVGSPAGGTVVKIVGENFTNATIVKFGGIPALRSLQSPGILIAVAPAHAAGNVDVEVMNGRRRSGLRNAFTYGGERDPAVKEQAPQVTSIQPNTGSTAGGYRITVNGFYFSRSSRVLLNGNYAQTTYVSPTALSAVVPPGESGSVDVSVSAEQGGTDTLQSAFLYNEPPQIVSITAVPHPIVRNTTTTITVEAVDPEAGSLSYEYRIAQGAGTLTQQGRTAVYGSPNVTGIMLIHVTVYDQHRAKTQGNIEIHVE